MRNSCCAAEVWILRIAAPRNARRDNSGMPPSEGERKTRRCEEGRFTGEASRGPGLPASPPPARGRNYGRLSPAGGIRRKTALDPATVPLMEKLVRRPRAGWRPETVLRHQRQQLQRGPARALPAPLPLPTPRRTGHPRCLDTANENPASLMRDRRGKQRGWPKRQLSGRSAS